MSIVAIVSRPIDTAALHAAVAGPDTGAVSIFIGAVRNHNAGRAVTGIEYSAYDAMAVRELTSVADEAEAEFAGVRIAVEHRIGELAIGDASVVVVAAHAHRRMAMDACTQVIEELKKRVPIWKCEHYVDGTREWVHAGAAAAGVAAPVHAATPAHAHASAGVAR